MILCSKLRQHIQPTVAVGNHSFHSIPFYHSTEIDSHSTETDSAPDHVSSQVLLKQESTSHSAGSDSDETGGGHSARSFWSPLLKHWAEPGADIISSTQHTRILLRAKRVELHGYKSVNHMAHSAQT